MSDHIIIREAVQADQSAMAEMMHGLNRFEHKISPDRNINPDAGAKHLAYAQGRVDRHGGFILIADDGGSAVGFLIGIVSRAEGHYIDPLKREFGDIHDLFVQETHRGCGLARQLLEQAEKRFKVMGLSRMELYVLEGNEKAIGLYKSQDFTVQELCMSKKI